LKWNVQGQESPQAHWLLRFCLDVREFDNGQEEKRLNIFSRMTKVFEYLKMFGM
jgi:hypothetical protein